mgnify:CR=1 FL=1
MKSIPWDEPNLYKYHSNPKELYGYSDDLKYMPSATQIYDALDFYDDWFYATSPPHDDGQQAILGLGDYTEWSLDLLINQALDARYDYDEQMLDGEEAPTLDRLSKVQLKLLYDFIMSGVIKSLPQPLDDENLVNAFAKFYKSRQ